MSELIGMLPGGQAERIEGHANAFWALVSMDANEHGSGVLPTAITSSLSVGVAVFHRRT